MGTKHTEKRVIVNADDLGFSQGVTEGIEQAHREGVVTSTTIITNMPGSEAAASRLPELPRLGVGVHLNVSQGRPLSSDGLALAGKDGVMRHTAAGVLMACIWRPWLLRAIEAEFDAQIRWALDHGIRPTHLDSHRHSHGFPLVLARVARLARRYNIPFVRRLSEKLPGKGWSPAPPRQRQTRTLFSLFGPANSLIARRLHGTLGTWGIAHTGLIDTGFLVRVAGTVQQGVTEIMVHPGLGNDLNDQATRLVQSRRVETEALCDPTVRHAFETNGVKLIHYGQI